MMVLVPDARCKPNTDILISVIEVCNYYCAWYEVQVFMLG